MYKIHLLPASYGDSILIEYGADKSNYILVDGGPSDNFEELVAGLQAVAPQLKELELLVVTHVDIDHIDGIVKFLNREKLPFKIKDIWFNGYSQVAEYSNDELAPLQGEYLSKLILEKKIPLNKKFKGAPIVVKDYAKLPVVKLKNGMKITLLSPSSVSMSKMYAVWDDYLKNEGKGINFLKKLESDKRYDSDDDLLGINVAALQKTKVIGDKSPANGSSIAFIAEYDSKTCLFAGDATSDYLLSAIDPLLKQLKVDKLKIDAWKLAHHGSKKSNLDKLMKKIDCKKILISTSGVKYKHPDAICIAKIITNNGPKANLYFNYETEFNQEWKSPVLQTKYNYKANYPTKKQKKGISLVLK